MRARILDVIDVQGTRTFTRKAERDENGTHSFIFAGVYNWKRNQ